MRRGRLLRANEKTLLARLRSEGGFGLIELLISMLVTSIAIMALVAALSSSHVAIVRASRISTSAALASKQMETFRAVKYADIRLDTSSVAAANATVAAMPAGMNTPAYTADPAYDPDLADRVTATCSPVTDICLPTRIATGADGRGYRVDTFIVYETPTSGRQVKRVTVVVRDGTNVRVRESSVFDEATGS